MGDLPMFKLVCDACGSMTIKLADADRAPETTIVECGRCKSPRGRWPIFATSPTDEVTCSSFNLDRRRRRLCFPAQLRPRASRQFTGVPADIVSARSV